MIRELLDAEHQLSNPDRDAAAQEAARDPWAPCYAGWRGGEELPSRREAERDEWELG